MDRYLFMREALTAHLRAQAAMVEVPALLDTRLGTTRELERFRNHLAIAAAVWQNYGRVRDIYEDRCALSPPPACVFLQL
jgi:hypothetical protein